ncbi:MAG: TspO/MBR family protein [Eubacteriales bacterium]
MSKFNAGVAFDGAKYEYRRSNKKVVVLVPLLLILLAIFTRWVSGSPVPTLHYISAREIIPPVWVMVLLSSISYIVAGISLGSALGNRFCSSGERKYQGAMWFCIALALGYAWYPIFFCSRLFLVSIIVTVLCVFCAVCATVCFISVSKIAFIFAFLYDIWLFYLAFLNFRIFFSI